MDAIKGWEAALEKANQSKRCGAKTRAKTPCKAPAMANGRCRMHGGKSTGAPCGKAHGRYKHGMYTNSMKRELAYFRELTRESREIMAGLV